MPVTVVLGAQWGDEGKGKIVDLLAQKADMCVRFSGGDNAGHTVGEFKLHLVPCGIFNPKTVCVIGNGVAVNPKSLLKEMDVLETQGVSCKNLIISSKAHLILPWHLALDALQEEERGEGKIGTTKKGIGPVFSDKHARFGFRMEDLISENMEQKLRKLWIRALRTLSAIYGYHSADLDYDYVLNYLLESRERIRHLIKETEPIIWDACDNKKRVLMEGAQGALLDPDFGVYPQTTSSSCILAGALQGSGVSWKDIKEVIGVVKAYTTRVGAGPFPTELQGSDGDQLREKGQEFGTTTGRPRRCGWFDAALIQFASGINGYTDIAVTKLDILDSFRKIKICTGYTYKGKRIHYYDTDSELLSKVKPIYKTLRGWLSPTRGITEFSKLPKLAQAYVHEIESLIGVRVSYISTGPKRYEFITRNP